MADGYGWTEATPVALTLKVDAFLDLSYGCLRSHHCRHELRIELRVAQDANLLVEMPDHCTRRTGTGRGREVRANLVRGARTAVELLSLDIVHLLLLYEEESTALVAHLASRDRLLGDKSGLPLNVSLLFFYCLSHSRQLCNLCTNLVGRHCSQT